MESRSTSQSLISWTKSASSRCLEAGRRDPLTQLPYISASQGRPHPICAAAPFTLGPLYFVAASATACIMSR